MTDLKISEFTDGGAIQETDQIAVSRSGDNNRVQVGTAAALDAGTGVGDLVQIIDSSGPKLPAIDGSLLTGITASLVSSANEATDATCFPLFITASGTQALQPKNNTGLTYNSNTNDLGATKFNGMTLTASTGTFTLANGKTITISNTLTFTGTDTSSVAFGAGGTVAYTGTKQSFTKQQNFGAVALTSSSNHIAWNLDNAQSAKHTFTENTTLDNPTNMVDGGTYVLILTQHASSPKTFALGNAYKTPEGAGFTVSSTNGAIDILTFVSDGTSMYLVGQKAFA